jgi:hypothetical protein
VVNVIIDYAVVNVNAVSVFTVNAVSVVTVNAFSVVTVNAASVVTVNAVSATVGTLPLIVSGSSVLRIGLSPHSFHTLYLVILTGFSPQTHL